MLTCPQKRLASVLLLRKAGFLLTFNSNNTLTLVSRQTRVAHKFLYCVNGSAWVVSNPVPCHISMVVHSSALYLALWTPAMFQLRNFSEPVGSGSSKLCCSFTIIQQSLWFNLSVPYSSCSIHAPPAHTAFTHRQF